MEVTLHIPDDVAQRLSASGGDLSRLGSICSGRIQGWPVDGGQLRKLLGFQTRDALEGLLKAHEVWLNYTMEDLERERAALRRSGFGS